MVFNTFHQKYTWLTSQMFCWSIRVAQPVIFSRTPHGASYNAMGQCAHCLLIGLCYLCQMLLALEGAYALSFRGGKEGRGFYTQESLYENDEKP